MFYRKNFLNYYAKHYLQYESTIESESFIFANSIVENFVLLNRRNKMFRIQRTTVNVNEAKKYLQNSVIANFEKTSLKQIWKIQLKNRYSTLNRMTKNVLSISADDVEIKKLFNQIRNIIYYRRTRLHAITIEKLMMLRMHTEKNMNVSFDNDDDDNDVKHYSINNVYVKTNVFSFSELSEVNEKKNDENDVIIVNETMNVVIKNSDDEMNLMNTRKRCIIKKNNEILCKQIQTFDVMINVINKCDNMMYVIIVYFDYEIDLCQLQMNETTKFSKTNFRTKRNLNFQFRFNVETKSNLKFSSRISTKRKISSRLSVPANNLLKNHVLNLIFKT